MWSRYQCFSSESVLTELQGFPGLSDSFGAALWGLDYAMQMAYSNFSGAMMHIGGQSVYYNVSYVA